MSGDGNGTVVGETWDMQYGGGVPLHGHVGLVSWDAMNSEGHVIVPGSIDETMLQLDAEEDHKLATHCMGMKVL